MRIFCPDQQFPGPADHEAAVAAEMGLAGVAFAYHRFGAAPEAEWTACDGMVVWHEATLDAAAIARTERCRIIVRAGVGYDNVDLAAAARRAIPVCNVPDYGTTDVADTAIALLLALRRGIASYDAALRADITGNWRVGVAPVAGRVRGGRFAVIGCGRIGTATLRRARAFEMEVAFFDPYLPDGVELALGCRRFDTLEKILGWADSVSLHTPANAETRNLIDAAAVEAMRPGAVLINTARGALVDLDALEAGLRSGRIAAAGLDVLPEEPPASHPLLDAYRDGAPWLEGRLVMTPHAAWYSEEGRLDLRTKSVRTALQYLSTGRLANCVNRDLLAHQDGHAAR